MNIWKLLPHPHHPVRPGPVDGYRCSLCGSRSSRVQLKGQRRYWPAHKRRTGREL